MVTDVQPSKTQKPNYKKELESILLFALIIEYCITCTKGGKIYMRKFAMFEHGKRTKHEKEEI